MSKKDKINEEELEILQKLFGKSEKPRIKISGLNDFSELEDLNKDKSESKEFLAQISENLDSNNTLKKENQRYKKLNFKEFHNSSMTTNLEKSKKKRRIKKKELFLNIVEVLPIIRENNKMLKELIHYYKSIEYSLKILTQEPIKIKFFK